MSRLSAPFAATCTLLLFAGTRQSGADLFNVQFTDNDGPQWTGVVDTSTDQLSFTSWSENGGGIDFWTLKLPTDSWSAVTSSGATYDVPDDWDGLISTSWAFTAPHPLSWPGQWNENTSTIDNYYAGWGGYRWKDSFFVGSEQMTLRIIPVNPLTYHTADADSVTVTAQGVPEPSTGALFLIGLAVSAGRRSRHRRRRAPRPGRRGSASAVGPAARRGRGSRSGSSSPTQARTCIGPAHRPSRA